MNPAALYATRRERPFNGIEQRRRRFKAALFERSGATRGRSGRLAPHVRALNPMTTSTVSLRQAIRPVRACAARRACAITHLQSKPGSLMTADAIARPDFFSRDRTVAAPTFNRWLVPPAALAIHLCIGMAYGFSVFWLPL